MMPSPSAEQLPYLGPLLDHTEDAIVAFDADWRVTVWNGAAGRMFGWTAEEALGQPATVLGIDESAQPMDRRRQLAQYGRWRGNVAVKRKDGTPVEVELIAAKVSDDRGNVTGYLMIHRDITERREAEQRVVEAREAERRRIARALHDDALQGLSDAIALVAVADLATAQPGLAGQLLGVLQRVGEQLRSAVYELHSGGEETGPFVELLARLVDEHRAMVGVGEIRLEIGEGVPAGSLGVTGVELLGIVGEALTNARRHARAERVRVSVGAGRDELWVEVSDDGRGFDTAGRVPAIHRGITGMRERAELLNGRLEIRSHPVVGTTMRVEAPLADATS